jgi:hypothetical protein
MRGAYNGGESGSTYFYCIKATAEQVKEYYDKEMPKVGWVTDDPGADWDKDVLRMYQKNGVTTAVGLLVEGDVVFVLIIQGEPVR